MTKMQFGEWVGAVIAGNSGCKVMKVGYDYFEMDAIVKAAKSIDDAIRTARLEERSLTPLESLMVEVLFSLAGWKGVKDAHQSYQRYLKSKDE